MNYSKTTKEIQFNDKLIVGNEFNLNRLGFETLLGYRTNRLSNVLGGNDNTFETLTGTTAISVFFGTRLNLIMKKTNNTIDDLEKKFKAWSEKFGFDFSVSE